MRKIIFALVLLVLAAPASAEVLITAAQVGDEPNVLVSYVNTEDQNVRAFALNIVIDGLKQGGGAATISAVQCLSTDYYVYPGSIEITDNEVTGEGSCVCDDSYDDTLPGIDSNGVTIEMASLYSPNDPDHNVGPAMSGDLVLLTIDGCADVTITITANELRGKIVMEDATSKDPNAPGGVAGLVPCGCMDPEDPDYANWVLAGEPNCWCYDCYDCGDTNGDCALTFADVSTLIAGWPPNPFDACADLTKDLDMTFGDVSVLIANWPPNGACDNCGECTPIVP
jgi:hypothetical protein